jgi:hypothetical protein
MSTPDTLANIFFEPAATFTALRERPRFLVAALIMAALLVGVTALILQRVNFEDAVRRAIENNPQTEQMDAEQKEQMVRMQTGPIGKTMAYAGPIVGTFVVIAAGAALYLLGVMLMGGKMSYRQALSVWTYSSFPPTVLGSILTVVLIFLKSAEDIDFSKPGAGLVVTSLGALVGSEGSPVLRAALSRFDLFTFYGMFLAAVGLRRVAKISSGSAWGVVIGLWLFWMIVTVAWAAIFG